MDADAVNGGSGVPAVATAANINGAEVFPSQSPFKDLPEELLESIVIHWSQIDEDAVWMASLVSKQWRRVVLGCPFAWSHVYISILPKQPVEENDPEWCIEEDYLECLSSPRRRARPIDLWVKHAAGSPLTLSVRAASTVLQVEVKVAQVLSLLKSHFHQLRHLRLITDTAAFQDVLVTLLTSVTKTWRTVHLSLNRYIGRIPTSILFSEFHARLPDVWTSLSRQPNATRLSLIRCLPELQSGHPGLAASARLRFLSMQDVDCEHVQMLHILAGCPNLETLHLSLHIHSVLRRDLAVDVSEDLIDAIPASLPEEPVMLHSLKRLSLHKMTTESCTVYLDHLDTPNFLHLSIRNEGLMEIAQQITQGAKSYEVMAPFGEAMTSFVAHTSQLQSFHLDDSPLPDRHLLKVLRRMQSLKDLRLSKVDVGTLGFRGLAKLELGGTGSSPRLALCSALEKLQVVECDFVMDEHLLEVARARTAESADRSLAFLEVRQCPKVTEGLLDALSTMMEPPLRIWIEVAQQMSDDGMYDDGE